MHLSIMAIIFIITRHFVKYFTYSYYQVEKVQLNRSSTEYFVTFFSKADKKYFVKKCSDIINNAESINKFSPVDIANIAEKTALLKYQNMLNSL